MTNPNQCQFWGCDEIILGHHFLCYGHHSDYEEGMIDQCQSCGRYKDAEYDLCKTCNRKTASAWKEQPSAVRQGPEYSGEALIEDLRSLRRNLAREHRMQEFRVFSNATLDEMVEKRPLTQEAMLTIYGVGAVKMEQFGWGFLQVIQQWAGMNAARQNPQSPPPSNAPQRDNREFAADKDADRFFVYVLLMNKGEYYIGQTRELLERVHEHRNGMSQSTIGREPKLQWFTTAQTRKEAADLEAELQKLNSNPAGRREINRWVVDFRQLVSELDHDPHQSTTQAFRQESRMPHGGVASASFRRSR